MTRSSYQRKSEQWKQTFIEPIHDMGAALDLAIRIKSDGYFVTNWWVIVITWTLIRGGKLRGRVNSTLVTHASKVNKAPVCVIARCIVSHSLVLWVSWEMTRAMSRMFPRPGSHAGSRGSSHDGTHATVMHCTVHSTHCTVHTHWTPVRAFIFSARKIDQ